MRERSTHSSTLILRASGDIVLNIFLPGSLMVSMYEDILMYTHPLPPLSLLHLSARNVGDSYYLMGRNLLS